MTTLAAHLRAFVLVWGGTSLAQVNADQSTDLDVAIVMAEPDLPPPEYAHDDDAGADLASAVDVTIEPGQRVMVGTGVSIALPSGYAAFVHPRSGLAVRHGLTIVNTPGTIDAGYRGELRVCLLNTDAHQAIEIRRGDKIAQMVIQRVERARFVRVDTLPDSERGHGGYGSTGGVSAWDTLERRDWIGEPT